MNAVAPAFDPSHCAILSRYPSGRAACIVLPRDREHLDNLVAGLKPELEHTVVPRDFLEPDVQATIDKAKDLPWVKRDDGRMVVLAGGGLELSGRGSDYLGICEVPATR